MQRMLASIILKQKKFGNTNSLCKNRSKEVILDRGPQSNRYPRIQSSLFWSIVNNVRIEGGEMVQQSPIEPAGRCIPVSRS